MKVSRPYLSSSSWHACCAKFRPSSISSADSKQPQTTKTAFFSFTPVTRKFAHDMTGFSHQSFFRTNDVMNGVSICKRALIAAAEKRQG
jgi:hypothetical protein